MTRSPAAIRAEIDRWKQRQREARNAGQYMEAFAAAIIVQTLAYALGDVAGPSVRIRVE